MVEQAQLLARAGCGLCGLLTVVNLVLLAVNWDTPSPTGLARSVEIVTAVAYASLAGVGSFLIARHSDNPVGWVFLVSGLLLAGSALASEYGTYGVLTNPDSLPAVELVMWAGAWGWWAGAGFGLTFGLMLYPNGVLPSASWRVVAAAAAVNLVVLVLLHALTPGPLDGEYSPVVNPFGVGSRTILRPLRDAGWLLLTVNILVAVTAVMARARGAGADQRRQLHWLAIPGLAALAAAPLWGLSGATDESPSATSQVLILAAVFGTPPRRCPCDRPGVAPDPIHRAPRAGGRRSVGEYGATSTTGSGRRLPESRFNSTWPGALSVGIRRPRRTSSRDS